MKLNRHLQIALRLLLILSLSGLIACSEKEAAKPDTTAGGSVVGLNYTGEGIQWFLVDGAGGGGVNRYGISGDVCCAMYPRKWTPELKVTVKWVRSDCEGQRQLCTLELIKQGIKWPYKSVEKTVPIEKYTEPGEVYVAFLPNDEVRVYISNVGVKNKAFPGNLGIPTDPDEIKRITP